MTESTAALDDNMPPDDVEEETAPVETETTEQAVDTTEESAPSSVEDSDETKPNKVQERINKITAEKYAEKRRADELARQLAEAKNATEQPKDSEAPKLEDFDYDEDAHKSAQIQYEARKAATELFNQQEQERRNNDALKQSQAVQTAFNEKVAEFSKTVPDYSEAVMNMPPLPDEVMDTIMQADNGPQLAHYLAKHLDVVDEICSVPANMANMKLGVITANLAKTKPETKPSAAPDPIEPVTTSGSLAKPVEEMSMEEIYNL